MTKVAVTKLDAAKVDVTGSADDRELTVRLTAVIRRVGRALRERAGVNQLSYSHTSILARLEREGSSTVTELAHAEGLRPQSMSAAIAELGAAGLACGVPDPHDGRRTILSLTDAGREAVWASRAERQNWLLHAICEKFSPDERKQLMATMELLERLG
jgi:DNA-binding MarR family transcriptional regulator